MRLWPFRRKGPDQEPADERWTIIATPWAAVVYELQSIGLTGPALLKVLQMIEAECSKTERRIRVQMNRAMVMGSEPVSPEMSPKVSPKMSPRKRPGARRRKWREKKRNQRAKLKLVHPVKGGDAA
jgi:hypothetical protein